MTVSEEAFAANTALGDLRHCRNPRDDGDPDVEPWLLPATAGHTKKDLAASYSQMGLFTGMYGLIAIFISLPAGILAATLRRKADASRRVGCDSARPHRSWLRAHIWIRAGKPRRVAHRLPVCVHLCVYGYGRWHSGEIPEQNHGLPWRDGGTRLRHRRAFRNASRPIGRLERRNLRLRRHRVAWGEPSLRRCIGLPQRLPRPVRDRTDTPSPPSPCPPCVIRSCGDSSSWA